MSYNYLKYRGKCKEYAQELCNEDDNLELVRGFYHCPLWGKEQHWWCKRKDTGEIVDPTVEQFPTCGVGATYEEFDGICECDQCGQKVLETNALFDSRYVFCSGECRMRFVGLYE